MKLENTPNHTFHVYCHGDNCMIAVGGSYEHGASPVADLDGCLILQHSTIRQRRAKSAGNTIS